MPTVAKSEHLPKSTHKFLALDVDGIDDLPSDWYLRICGVASHALKGGPKLEEDLPRKKLLVDYWHSRPRKQLTGEELAGASPSSGAGSSSTHEQQVAQAFALVPERRPDDPPPPPYSFMSGDDTTETGTGGAIASSTDAVVSSAPATNSATRPVQRTDSVDHVTSILGSTSLSADPATTGSLGPSSSPPAGGLNFSVSQNISASTPTGMYWTTRTMARSGLTYETVSAYDESATPVAPLSSGSFGGGGGVPYHQPHHASTLPPIEASGFTPLSGPTSSESEATPTSHYPAAGLSAGGAHSPYTPHHVNTLPPTSQGNVEWPQPYGHAAGGVYASGSVSAPAVGGAPSTPYSPGAEPHHPHHANTLPPVLPQQTYASGAYAPGGSWGSQPHPPPPPSQQQFTTPAHAAYTEYLHHPHAYHRPGEAASYYENHPALVGTAAAASTSTGAPSSWSPPATNAATQPQSSHPQPHHANSWAPSSTQYPQNTWQHQQSAYQSAAMSPPGSTSPPPQSAGAGVPYSNTQYVPHHAYTVGPGASASPPPQTQSPPSSASASYFPQNQQQQQPYAPALPPRPSASSGSSSSARCAYRPLTRA